MKIPASPTAVLRVAPSSANRLLFLLVAKPQPDPLYTPASPCQEKGQQLYLLPPSFVIFCWKHPFSLGNSNHITDISSGNQPMRIMNTFNGSVAGISCFIYSCIAFPMEIKCKKDRLAGSAERYSKNGRDTLHQPLAENSKAGSYPPSHTQCSQRLWLRFLWKTRVPTNFGYLAIARPRYCLGDYCY